MRVLLLVGVLAVPAADCAAHEDDPLLFKLMLDQLELRDADGGDPLTWQAQAWVGRDLNKLWLKTEGERVHGDTEEAEVQALYSHAVAPFWDLQAGWRHDLRPRPSRDWAVLGVKGLAPYLFEVDAALFLGPAGRTAARLQAEYELLLTQRLILSPELELKLYGKADPEVGIGAGLATADLGLRLRYEIRREFAPYVGLNWSQKFGRTADFARAEGASADDLQFVVGIRAWF
jgi:copper resistance protein B